VHRFGGMLRRGAGKFIPRLAPPVRCLACGRDRAAGARLIAGPGLYICTDCIDAGLPRPSKVPALVTFDRCRWCRAPRLASQLKPVHGIPTCTCCQETLAALAKGKVSTSRPDT